jgi:hypothetical protein
MTGRGDKTDNPSEKDNRFGHPGTEANTSTTENPPEGGQSKENQSRPELGPSKNPED